MMAVYKYAIASGHDAASLDNIEDICTTAPTSKPKKRGSVRRRTLNQAAQFNGTVSVFWQFDAATETDFNTLLRYLGDITVGSAPVTIRTRNETPNGWSIYNAEMINPQSEDEWDRAIGGYGSVEPLTIEFVISGLTFDEILDEFGFQILDENGDPLLEG